jgi:hypothetical protein
MSKIIDASCQAGVVTADGVPVTTAEVLSEGVASSTGILVMDEDRQYYVTSSAQDLSGMIESMTTILEQIIVVVTALDGVTVSPGSVAAAITQLGVLKTQFGLTKDMLK